MKIGTSLYSMCLEECKKSYGTHDHCHSPCSRFANSFGRRQKTDETDENLKEALERLLEEYLRDEEGQSLRQKIESKDSQKQAQEQEHQVMKIGSGKLYSMCLKECKTSLGTHEHCHSPCSKFAISFERLLEEYLREEEGQS